MTRKRRRKPKKVLRFRLSVVKSIKEDLTRAHRNLVTVTPWKWELLVNGRHALGYFSKASALASARMVGRQIHEAGHAAQLHSQGRNGRWKEEASYGTDSRRHKG